MTTKSIRLQVIDILRGFAEVRWIINDECGICYNLQYALLGQTSDIRYSYQLVKLLSFGWEKHTGISVFPVPSHCLPEWKNPNRIELCLYLADKLEGMTDDELEEALGCDDDN